MNAYNFIFNVIKEGGVNRSSNMELKRMAI